MIIGSGVDVIEIARVERALGQRGERFERRVFTPGEIEDCRATGRPAAHYAVRFAAKEAVMKAIGTGWARGVRWVDIETVSTAGAEGPRSDRVALILHGAVERFAADMAKEVGGEPHPHLAVSRSRTHAVATVLLEAALR